MAGLWCENRRMRDSTNRAAGKATAFALAAALFLFSFEEISLPAPPAAPPAPQTAAAKAATDQLVRFGTKWLDLEAQALRDDEGNEHPLTASEFSLLKVFAANPKRVLSRERLLELANARDSEAFDRAVDLRIMRIRRKIEPDPTKPAVIRTIRGGGYLFSPTGDKT